MSIAAGTPAAGARAHRQSRSALRQYAYVLLAVAAAAVVAGAVIGGSLALGLAAAVAVVSGVAAVSCVVSEELEMRRELAQDAADQAERARVQTALAQAEHGQDLAMLGERLQLVRSRLAELTVAHERLVGAYDEQLAVNGSLRARADALASALVAAHAERDEALAALAKVPGPAPVVPLARAAGQ